MEEVSIFMQLNQTQKILIILWSQGSIISYRVTIQKIYTVLKRKVVIDEK